MTELYSKGWRMVGAMPKPMVDFDGVPGLNPRTLAFQNVKVDGITYVVLAVKGLQNTLPDVGQPFSLLLQRSITQ